MRLKNHGLKIINTIRFASCVSGFILLGCIGCPITGRIPPDITCDSADDCAACTDCLGPEVCRCDDGIDCTVDVCDRGTCVFTPDDAFCDDGVHCTVDVCGETGCTSTPDDSVCHDGIDCTQDVCGQGGCASTPDDSVCTAEHAICLTGHTEFEVEGVLRDCLGCCDPCIARCPGLGGCPPLEEFPGLEDARADLIERLQDLDCASDFPFAVAGRCADGTRFLYELLDLFSLVGYFDENTGAYFAFQTTSDVVIPPCNGVFYGPTRFSCEDATVTEVLCGNAFDVGDMIDSLEK